MNYEQLIAEHDTIDQAVTRLRTLAEDTVPEVGAVLIALSDLAGELSHHLAHEDSFIYPRMIGGANTAAREAANAFVSNFAELRVDWSVYLCEWSADCVADDWAGFKAATLTMADRLAARVKAENELIYTVALRDGVIALRKAA